MANGDGNGVPSWVKWLLGVAATVVSGLLVTGFIDYITLRDQVQILSRAGGIESVIDMRGDISDLKSRLDRAQEQRVDIIEAINRIQNHVDRLERRVDELHDNRKISAAVR